MANINVRIDKTLKQDAEAVFKKLGITATTAINMFYVQVIRTNRIPFNLIADEPNQETIDAINESVEIDKDPSKHKSFDNVNDLLEDLKNDL